MTIFIGWKEIGNAVGGVGWQTVKKIAYKYNMPLATLNGRPSISALELEVWWARVFLEQRADRKKA